MPEIQTTRLDRGASMVTASGSSGADGEARRRGERRLDRAGRQGVGNAELVAGVGAEGVVRGQLLGHLVRQAGLEAAAHVDGGELAQLGGGLELQLLALLRQVGLLGIGLRMDRDVFAGGHRHGAGRQAGDAGQEQAALRGVGRRHADQQARGRDDAVVGAEDGGAEPADAVGAVAFEVAAGMGHGRYSQAMLIVTGSIAARADTIDELRRASLEHVARSRGEPGCLEHGVAIDANDGLRLVFFERWEDRAALEAHFKVPASRAFAAQAGRLAARPPELAVYEASALSLR